ncbi:hypothetical protein FE257_012941 [Aspergillus nanangensis]|uniref:DUF1907 domain-containing protein n=1 Tax=Aspergillus nanangensis TaxID=2582783 RepID=A0AAD4GPM9_ASPNN|nr:hypothetical protein FE257_012941 [Aspergillus nanangensis]
MYPPIQTQKFPLSPPSLSELAQTLHPALSTNYTHSSISIAPCPDLRNAPFHLATQGLCGEEKIADIGGQAHLFPRPRLDRIYSMTEIAHSAMEMSPTKGGSIIGAGAGPFHLVGQNCELATSFSWDRDGDREGIEGVVDNQSYITRMCNGGRTTSHVRVEKSPSTECALMANLYGSLGEPGPVLKITARGRKKGGEKSFTECIRQGLRQVYGEERTVSLGGVFVVKAGTAKYHVMPDFPGDDKLPFKHRGEVEEWLTFHEFAAEVVGLSVLHSADPRGEMGLRMEHTHCFSVGSNAGGHYHGDVGEEEVEYEGYFNTAKVIYRVDMPGM